MTIRDSAASDIKSILRLNEAAVKVTSPMDQESYLDISKEASLDLVADVDDMVAGFLLALPEGANYQNGNYRWFSDQFSSFLYIDRIVVDENHQGSGIGRAFYAHVIDWAEEREFDIVACEIDIEPPNPGSLRFHEKLGFDEIGTRQLENGKRVSMRIKTL